jgi:hypothetical protein
MCGSVNTICQKYVQNTVARSWNKINQKKMKYPNEDTKKNGHQTEKYKEEN